MASANAPDGPGWVKLSERIYMNNLQPLKKNKMVYKGKHHINGESHDIAVKLVSYDEKSLEEVKLHLKMEDHANIIQLYDADLIGGGVIPHIYIAMELCSQTLKDFIEERKSIPLDFKLYFLFAKQIVSAVAHIHQHNILHRDLKLENILLSSTKDNVRVADFGLSKQLLEGHSVATASFRGLGTDGYRAPELLHEKPMASYRSDSFSLGIVLAMLFSNGQHPFGPDPSRWRTNITDNEGQDLSHILTFKEPYHHKRALLIDLIEQCLQTNPKARPTPEQMLQHAFFSTTDGQDKEGRKEGIIWKLKDGFQNSFSIGGSSKSMEESQTFVPDMVTDDTDDDDLAGQEGDAGDPIDQFLIARKKKLKSLERDLAKALKNGQANRSQILEELKKLTETDELDIILPLAEYELVHKKNDACIEKVRHIVFESGSRSAWDVRQKAEKLYQQREYVQSLILFKLAHDLHKKEGKFSPDNEAKWIEDLVTDITNAHDSLLTAGGRLSEIAKMHGLRPAEELLYELRALDGATPSVKALHEVGCLANIMGDLNDVREYEKSIQYGKEGVAMMEGMFGENAEYYKDYGGMLNNMGSAYGHIGQYSKAQECFSKSIEITSKAVDYDNEEKRKENLTKTKNNLDSNRGKIHITPLSTERQ